MSFPNTKLALKGFEKDAVARAEAWDKAKTNEEVLKCVRVDNEARLRVCNAYWEDTKAYNTLGACQVMTVLTIREITKL